MSPRAARLSVLAALWVFASQLPTIPVFGSSAPPSADSRGSGVDRPSVMQSDDARHRTDSTHLIPARPFRAAPLGATTLSGEAGRSASRQVLASTLAA